MRKFRAYKWSKKLPRVPEKLPTKGQVRIRPISFRMDRITDKYVITGGGHKPVITGSKSHAMSVANARIRVLEKREKRKK